MWVRGFFLYLLNHYSLTIKLWKLMHHSGRNLKCVGIWILDVLWLSTFGLEIFSLYYWRSSICSECSALALLHGKIFVFLSFPAHCLTILSMTQTLIVYIYHIETLDLCFKRFSVEIILLYRSVLFQHIWNENA